nr:hypothetical protein [Hymenobacter coccineus]
MASRSVPLPPMEWPARPRLAGRAKVQKCWSTKATSSRAVKSAQGPLVAELA